MVSRGPVTPETARPAPHVPTKPSEAPLPSRVPGRGPDGGPDRLGATNDAEAQPSEVPTFEAPAVDRPTDSGLPSRIPGQGPDGGPDRLAGVPAPQRSQDLLTDLEEPLSTVPPTDPDSLRDRLRAFQAEFKSAADAEPGHDDEHNDHTGGHDHLDLGGDRR